MALNPFIEWLEEVAADPVVIRPDSIEAEAHGNLWSFALSPEQRAVVSVAEVARFASEVATARSAWLRSRNASPMTLHWWHDAPAGQLRFSLVSAAHKRLPFDCGTVAAPFLEAVIEKWLNSPSLHAIPFSELQPDSPEQQETPGVPLLVWWQSVP